VLIGKQNAECGIRNSEFRFAIIQHRQIGKKCPFNVTPARAGVQKFKRRGPPHQVRGMPAGVYSVEEGRRNDIPEFEGGLSAVSESHCKKTLDYALRIPKLR